MNIIAAFSRCVASSPNAIALSHRGQHWSYRQLDEHSNRLARWLRRRARLEPQRDSEPLIPVCLEQGPERISALLAVLKLGGAFVPIEPDYPAVRIRYMLDDIDARVLITESALRCDMLATKHDARPLELLEIDTDKLAIASEDPSELRVDIGPESLCYVMYTSGSTGQPKGVAIPHRGVTRLVDAVRRLLSAQRPPQRLLNVYGPTENTTFSTFFPIVAMPEPGIPVPIGRAIRGTSCRIVDSELRAVAVGQTGELLVGGLGLARNYRNQPETTAERFIAAATLGGEQLYRTGDQVRELPSGDLVFVGRLDNQVKIRGFRIELGEIELALEAHPSLARAVVSVAEDGLGTRRLIAHLLVQASLTPPSVAELRAFMKARLPSFMMPARFVWVETLPLGPTGKIDRKALAAVGGEVSWAEAFVEPRSELERWLCRVWAKRLCVPEEQIGVEHDFFALGGHSLLAVSIVADVREQRSIELRAQELFGAPTIAQLRRRSSARVQRRRSRSCPSNEPMTCPCRGHKSSCGCTKSARPMCVRTRLPYHDLRHLPERRAEARALELARRQATRSFQLDSEPLMRFTLVRLDEDRSRLYLAGHHLVLDGVGIGQVFLPELEIVYRQLEAGVSPSLPPLRFGYRDWLVWQQHERAARECWDMQESFWRHKLAELTPLRLPVDHTRSIPESYVGARQCLALSESTTMRLRELARRECCSLFAVLFAAVNVLLFRWTGERDIAICTVVAGRDLAGLDQHVGDFLNLLILRSEVAPDGSFLDALAAARATLTEAFAHQDVPFQRVARHAKVSGGDLPARVAHRPRIARQRATAAIAARDRGRACRASAAFSVRRGAREPGPGVRSPCRGHQCSALRALRSVRALGGRTGTRNRDHSRAASRHAECRDRACARSRVVRRGT